MADEKLAEIRVTEDGKVYMVDKVGNKFLLKPWDTEETAGRRSKVYMVDKVGNKFLLNQRNCGRSSNE